jgi:hypothetical protein
VLTSHVPWLERFFAAPNGLDWAAVASGSEAAVLSETLRPWLKLLADEAKAAPVILPFVRDGKVTGWYAAARERDRTEELSTLLTAWFGMAWMSRFDRLATASTDPMATALRDAFGSTVFRFAGGDAAANRKIAGDLVALADLLAQRPVRPKIERRPVGTIRAEFDRALLIADEARAKALLDELTKSGRLNDENLRFLDVRLRAGLGLWPQIAHDHWLIKTLSELALPPQIIADLIEALYRTHLDPIEAGASAETLLATFAEQVAARYPRLFASRRGVRTPRVVKAFLLFERSQVAPNPQIVAELAALLSAADRGQAPYSILAAPVETDPGADLDAANEAFDDGQTDRAFEFYLALPCSKKTLNRLVLCASMIGTAEAIDRLIAKIDCAGDQVDALTAPNRQKFKGLRESRSALAEQSAPLTEAVSCTEVVLSEPPVVPAIATPLAAPAGRQGWLDWVGALRAGLPLPLAGDAAVTWDTALIANDAVRAEAFADDLGNTSGDCAMLARLAVPTIYSAFIGEETAAGPATKPIANTLFMLVAMDESLSQVDLGLLAQLLNHLLTVGLSDAEYLSLVDVLSDVETRVGAYVNVAWALDVAEALAIAPAPSVAAKTARQQLFWSIVIKGHSFAHRLRQDERHSFRILALDYDIDPEALGAVGRIEEPEDGAALPDLSGKAIGIYTLTEAAGARAKSALEAMFPSVVVTLNADTVATARLTSLAKNADYFVFAWRSSSHSAYYCIKEAMGDREPIMAMGKGSASILRAVFDAVR